MKLLYISILFGLVVVAHGSPIQDTESLNENSVEAADTLVHAPEAALKREKRNFPGIFSFVIGETILDIQCRRGYLTVCAPDGPDACPQGYGFVNNVGECGFSTLNWYLNSSNIAGTCCSKLPTAVAAPSAAPAAPAAAPSAVGGAPSAAGAPTAFLIPQIVAYPVYAQYPYAIGSAPSAASGSSGGATGSGTSSGTTYTTG